MEPLPSPPQAPPPSGRRVLLIVGGGIAAYKALELVRLYRRAGIGVRTVLTRSGAEFVTPLSLGTLSEDRVFTELFSLTDEQEIGHIELSREADLLVVAPASANLLATEARPTPKRPPLRPPTRPALAPPPAADWPSPSSASRA